MAILCNICGFYHATHKGVAAAWFYFVARCSNIFSRYLLNGAWRACTGHGVIFSWACGAASGQGMYQVCYSRYRVSFYLWLIGSVLKHCKVPKYYDHDCSLSVSYCAWFLNKNVSVVIFYWLTKFHCLIAFASWDIGQYMNCNCLLTGCDVRHFEVTSRFFCMTRKSRQKFKYLENEKAFKMK